MQKVTFFDLDHTLIPMDSDYEWGVFTTSLGWNEPETFNRLNDAFFQQYKDGTLDIAAYVRFATAGFRKQGPQAAALAHQRYMKEVIDPAIRPQALALVRGHIAAGDSVLVVTATNEFVTRPIAKAFGVVDLIAIDLDRDPGTGWITGEIHGVPSFREGKVARVEAWLTARGLGWQDVDSTFYSDSMNDLALLEKVNHPVATNPDDRLRAIARERSWRILDLFNGDTK